MKACVLEQPRKLQLRDLPVPEIQDDEVLLRVTYSGICTNDVRDYKGSRYTYPRIGGHEYAGVIEKRGDAVNPQLYPLQAKAVTYIIDECGSCYPCKHGNENLCDEAERGKTFYNPDGISGYKGFCEYVKVPARHLCTYPDSTPDELMALTEPLACVLNSINATGIKMGQDVVVIGAGVMGLLHVLCAVKQGARVIVSEPDEARRKFALKLGASGTIDPLHEDPVKRIRELTDGRGANVVYNTTAVPAIAEQAVEMAGKGGVVAMFSSIHPNEPILVDAGRVHSQQITITGTVSPTIVSFSQAIDCIAKGIIDVSPLIDRVFMPEEITEAMEYAMRPDTFKVLIRFS